MRQPVGVWETGRALYEVEEKAFLQSSIKRQRDDSRLLDFFCLIQWKGLCAPCAFVQVLLTSWLELRRYYFTCNQCR